MCCDKCSTEEDIFDQVLREMRTSLQGDFVKDIILLSELLTANSFRDMPRILQGFFVDKYYGV
jgi:hypothetical protein